MASLSENDLCRRAAADGARQRLQSPQIHALPQPLAHGAHLASLHGHVIGIAVHEADEAAVGHDLERARSDIDETQAELDDHLTVVPVDDVIDVLIEEQTEDILRMAGVEPGALDKPYFDNPILRVVRKRIGWLLLLFVAGTLTSAVLHRFEAELAAVVALSFFIPLLIGTGGNAGAQTVMTVIRSLALGEVGVRHAWRVVLREATTGLVVGLLVAPIAFGQALLWQAPITLALTVSLTMFAICIWSTTVGSLIPIAAQRFGVDPAVLSAPLITTLVDATGLIIYFTIAKLILHV